MAQAASVWCRHLAELADIQQMQCSNYEALRNYIGRAQLDAIELLSVDDEPVVF